MDVSFRDTYLIRKFGDRGFVAFVYYFTGFFLDFYSTFHKNGLNTGLEKGFMDPGDMIEELEEDIDEIEHGFQDVKDEKASGTVREKQEEAEDILEEIHQQLRFLKEQVEDTKE